MCAVRGKRDSSLVGSKEEPAHIYIGEGGGCDGGEPYIAFGEREGKKEGTKKELGGEVLSRKEGRFTLTAAAAAAWNVEISRAKEEEGERERAHLHAIGQHAAAAAFEDQVERKRKRCADLMLLLLLLREKEIRSAFGAK